MSSRAPVHDPRPRSAVSSGVGLVGLTGLLLWTAVARMYNMVGPLAALVALLSCAVPMVVWSLLVDKVHRSPSTGIDWDNPPRPRAATIDISIVKIVGLWAIWGVIGCLYCLGRWYWRDPYLFSMQIFAVAVVPLVIASIPYVVWLDTRLKEPKDGAWHFGQLLIGRIEDVDRDRVYDFLRSWAIKGFFLAFMLAIVPGPWAETVGADTAAILASPMSLAVWLITAMFMIDVTMAALGYALTLKVLDAHIRSANPYASGWTAALICYPPFLLMDAGGPLDYRQNGAEWTYWLADQPVLAALNGAWLVFLTGIYAWATVAFGIRFSNLTHRGILTHGPYAFSKHPAYVSKNLFWWFALLPFLATNGNMVDMIRNTALLAAISGIYYWRARTEERHLSADPDYRDYAAWMARNGLGPRFVRFLIGAKPPPPASAPAAAAPAE